MRLGLDSYSVRWQGWDAFRILEYAASLGLDNVQFSERGALASLDPAYLESLKRRADDLGLSIEVGMLSFDRYSSFFRAEYGSGEQQLADVVRAAQVVGSPIVRCLLGGQSDRIGPAHDAGADRRRHQRPPDLDLRTRRERPPPRARRRPEAAGRSALAGFRVVL